MARGGARVGAGRKKGDKKPKASKPVKIGTLPVGRPSTYDPSYCQQVVEVMAQGYSLTAFAGKIGCSRSTINLWIDAHHDFMEAVKRGKARRLYQWETSALRVAEKGGGPGTSTIIMFGLKNMGDGEWAEKTETKLVGADGGPVQIQRIERVIVDPADTNA